jgi:hypothetical protein
VIVKMLEAVSTLLEDSKEIKVGCAKTILDKVIEGMKDKDKLPPYITVKHEAPAGHGDLDMSASVKPKPTPKRVPSAGEVEIGADGGIIKFIKNATDDTKVIIDGAKPIPWQDAIGKTFTEITLV